MRGWPFGMYRDHHIGGGELNVAQKGRIWKLGRKKAQKASGKYYWRRTIKRDRPARCSERLAVINEHDENEEVE